MSTEQHYDDRVRRGEEAAESHRNAPLRMCDECVAKIIPTGLLGVFLAAVAVMAWVTGERAAEMVVIGVIAAVLCVWSISIAPRHQSRLDRSVEVARWLLARERGDFDHWESAPASCCCSREQDRRAGAGAAVTTTAAVAAIIAM